MQGRHEEALEFIQESARVLEASLGPHHRRTLFALRNMATEYAWMGDWERSAELAEELTRGFEELGGPKDIDLAWALQTYGTALGRLSRLEEADSVLARGYAIAKERLGDHDLTGSFLFQRAALYRLQGRPEDALEQVREAVRLYGRLYDDHPRLADALRRQGTFSDDPEEKIASFREAAQMMTRLEGEEGPGATRLTLEWARALVSGGRHSEALPLFETLERTLPAAYGPDHAYAPAPYFGEAEAYLGLGDRATAREALEAGRGMMVGGADVEVNREWLARIEEALKGTG
jgi:tetratricopeptide (TPR) repeat protein